jgi:hypothetical protein
MNAVERDPVTKITEDTKGRGKYVNNRMTGRIA